MSDFGKENSYGKFKSIRNSLCLKIWFGNFWNYPMFNGLKSWNEFDTQTTEWSTVDEAPLKVRCIAAFVDVLWNWNVERSKEAVVGSFSRLLSSKSLKLTTHWMPLKGGCRRLGVVQEFPHPPLFTRFFVLFGSSETKKVNELKRRGENSRQWRASSFPQRKLLIRQQQKLQQRCRYHPATPYST